MKLVFKSKRCQSIRHRGFTLIELITVMSIMVIILSLVGPLTIKFIDKAQAQTEFINLKNNLKKISYITFASSTPYVIDFNKNSASVFKSKNKINEYKFTYLNFERQSVEFNSRGYPYPETLSVSFLNRTEIINLFKLIEGEDARIAKK